MENKFNIVWADEPEEGGYRRLPLESANNLVKKAFYNIEPYWEGDKEYNTTISLAEGAPEFVRVIALVGDADTGKSQLGESISHKLHSYGMHSHLVSLKGFNKRAGTITMNCHDTDGICCFTAKLNYMLERFFDHRGCTIILETQDERVLKDICLPTAIYRLKKVGKIFDF